MSKEMYCRVTVHYENVPRFMWRIAEKEFMKNRSKAVDVFNELIDQVNEQWDLTGKPTLLSDNIEDINPEYSKFIQTQIQPAIDKLNKRFPICKYKIDEFSDITGYIPHIKNSKIWVTLKLI